MATNFIRNKGIWIVFLLILAFIFPYVRQCFPARSGTTPQTVTETTPPKPAINVTVPGFNADSAYHFVKKQVDFGPRVPGSTAHKKCAQWLVSEFKRFGMSVIEQKFVAQTYFGPLDAVNIIAQYKPELKERVLLTAHWDSRHIGDKDTKDQNKPILGANDGASGVGVLLELARLLHNNPVEYGVDLICFDAEDLGDDREPDPNASIMAQPDNESRSRTWCLGSQYWARNLHRAGYTAQFGVLFDLVGAKGAKFPFESYSTQNAPRVQNQIWNIASELGYGSMFPRTNAGFVTDDHVFVTLGTRIPMVDLISIPDPPPNSFGAYHHTHDDNMSIIDPYTLGVVGEVSATMVYRVAAGAFL